MKRFLWIAGTLGLLGVVAVAVMVFFLKNASTRRPDGLGVKNGRLPPCPRSPNCVCSFDADEQHAIEPLAFDGPPDEAFARLREAIAAMPGATIVAAEGDYLHAEFKTPLIGFIDDAEFLLDRDASRIHCRSASRVGRSDLGANRARIEAVRKAFAESRLSLRERASFRGTKGDNPPKGDTIR